MAEEANGIRINMFIVVQTQLRHMTSTTTGATASNASRIRGHSALRMNAGGSPIARMEMILGDSLYSQNCQNRLSHAKNTPTTAMQANRVRSLSCPARGCSSFPGLKASFMARLLYEDEFLQIEEHMGVVCPDAFIGSW